MHALQVGVPYGFMYRPTVRPAGTLPLLRTAACQVYRKYCQHPGQGKLSVPHAEQREESTELVVSPHIALKLDVQTTTLVLEVVRSALTAHQLLLFLRGFFNAWTLKPGVAMYSSVSKRPMGTARYSPPSAL